MTRSFSPISKVYKVFLFASLTMGLMTLFPMPFLYVHFYYSAIYMIAFVLGILVGNVSLSLFQWKFSSIVWPTIGLHMGILLSIFLFPFSHQFYTIAFSIRLVLLGIVFLIGIFTFLLYKTFKTLNTEQFFLLPLLFFFLALCFSLLLQIYATNSSWEIYGFMFFLLLNGIFATKNRWILIFWLLVFALGMTGMIIFQKYGLFYVNTDSHSPETRIFDMGEQVDIYKAQQATKKDLNIANSYTGDMDSYKNIYLNGRHYGKLVESKNREAYAFQTPLSVLFSLQEDPRVLILNSSGGGDVSLTHFLVSGEIDALEENQDILDQIRDRESLYVGGIYHNRNTLFYHSSIRPYIATTNKRYDTILLNYIVDDPSELFFLQEREAQFSVGAIRDYLRILNPQGMIFVNIQTFSPNFTQAVLLSFLSTLQQTVPLNPRQWDQLLCLFQTPYGLNMIFSRAPLSEEKRALYQKKLEELQYQNIDPESDLGKDTKALLYKDKNRQYQLLFSAKPIEDNGNNWIYSVFRNMSLFSSHVLSFSFPVVQKIFLGVFFGCLLLFFLFRHQFKKQQLYNMGLGLFFSYLAIVGVIIGLDFSFGIELFNILQANSFVFGKVFIAALLCSQMAGVFLVLYPSWHLYLKIQFSLYSQLLVHGILFLGFPYILEFFVVSPLAWRIVFPSVLAFILYMFLFSTPALQLVLASCMQEEEGGVLFSSLILGILMGLCIGFSVMFYAFISVSLGICIFLLLIVLFYGYFLDARLKSIDYVYSKRKI